MEVVVKARKIEEKDIRLNSVQVWDNNNKERIMTVADGDTMFHVINLSGHQLLLMPVFSRSGLVDYLNQYGYTEYEAELVLKV